MILYACVSDVRTKEVLAEHQHEDENENENGHNNLASLAVRCIDSAPKFHVSYSHTACNRIYAFLMMDHHQRQQQQQQQQQQEGGEEEQSLELIFFAIADVSLGSANTFFFLRCLRQAFATRPSSTSQHLQPRRLDHDLFLPVLHLLSLDASLTPPAAPEKKQEGGEEDKRSLPLTTFASTDEGYDDDNDDHYEKQQHSSSSSSSSSRTKGSKGKSRRKKNDDCKEATQEEEEEEEDEKKKKNSNTVNVSSSHSRGMEEIISVVDHHHHHHRGHHPDLHIVHVRGKRSLLSAHRLWTQYVRLVLLIDLVVCTLMFGIWLSVCGGFHCITN